MKKKSLKDLVQNVLILLPDGFSRFLPRRYLFSSNKFIQLWQNFNIWCFSQENSIKVTQNQDEIKKYGVVHGEMVPNIIFSKLVRYKTTFILSLVIKHNFNGPQNSFWSGFLEVQILLPFNFRCFRWFSHLNVCFKSVWETAWELRVQLAFYFKCHCFFSKLVSWLKIVLLSRALAQILIIKMRFLNLDCFFLCYSFILSLQVKMSAKLVLLTNSRTFW